MIMSHCHREPFAPAPQMDERTRMRVAGEIATAFVDALVVRSCICAAPFMFYLVLFEGDLDNFSLYSFTALFAGLMWVLATPWTWGGFKKRLSSEVGKQADT